MKRITDLVEQRPWTGWVLFGSTLVLVFLAALFGATIVERRGESSAVQRVQPLADWEPRNEVWGRNYPRQYETYLKSQQSDLRTAHGGSAPRDLLEENPRLVVLWAGYAFAKDYKQARGHARAVEDIRATLRTGQPQPGTCWACKSPDVPRLMHEMGVSAFYKSKWADLGTQVVNPIGCQDCHDPKTMRLAISRPALAEAFQRMGKDISKATHQEMRSLVCAQCHVEYYFKGKEDKYLTFPWDKGLSAEAMEAYYDAAPHTDWVHALSKAPMLKAQHPDYELFTTGIHAERGVACADCHMPYVAQGGVKFSDHHVRSPLANIANACAVCHRESESTLMRNVVDRQNKVSELMRLAEDALVRAHVSAKAAWAAGATEEEMQPALTQIRHAQWRWDWVAAANGVGFHSPTEACRVLGTAIQKAESAVAAISRVLWSHGCKDPVPLPDLTGKEAAQRAIGLDPAKMAADKEAFLREVVPGWDRAAAERQAAMPAP